MPFSQTEGYTPLTIEAIMELIRPDVNTQFNTTYTSENFIGSNHYKYFYALAQRLQASETKTNEVFLKLQQYIATTNESISRPVVTNPGLIDKFETEGYVASVKPMIEADAGKVNVCVDVLDNHARGLITITSYANLVSGTDDSITVKSQAFTAQVGAATPGAATFQAATSNSATAISLAAQINAHAVVSTFVTAQVVGETVVIRSILVGTVGNTYTLAYTDNDTNIGATVSAATLLLGLALGDDDEDYDDVKLDIATIIKDSTVAGSVSQGNEIETIVLTNGQSFDFKFHLPDRHRTYLKLTITTSENNQFVVSTPTAIKTLLIANIAAAYKLGRNFEPQKYFSIEDAPWASSILLQYSFDNSSWVTTVIDADFDDLYECALVDVTLVEA